MPLPELEPGGGLDWKWWCSRSQISCDLVQSGTATGEARLGGRTGRWLRFSHQASIPG